MTGENPEVIGTDRAPRWRGWLIVVAKVIAAVVIVWFVLEFVRRVDWAEVVRGISHLNWWEICLLLLLVALRQTVVASPLIFLLPGLRLGKAVLNGLSGTLIQTFMPPPSDVLLRLTMLRSWGFESSRALAALTLNTVVFYIARFAAPVLGLVVVVIFSTPEAAYWWWAAIGAGVTGLIVTLLALVARGENFARKIGLGAGRWVHRIRQSVDPEKWATALVEFQRNSSEGLARRMSLAVLSMMAFVVVDGTVAVACLRFVGIGPSQLPYFTVMAAFLCVYPLTVFPFAGLGVLDAALVALLIVHTSADPSDMVAAFIIWRTATLLVPLIPGLGALTIWRRSQSGQEAGTATAIGVTPG